MDITKEALQDLLIQRWNYSEHSASQAAEKLLNMDSELQIEFSKFLESGELSGSYRLFGMKLGDIADVFPLKAPAVFLFFDWVIRDPKNALNALVDEYNKSLPETFDPQAYKEYINKN